MVRFLEAIITAVVALVGIVIVLILGVVMVDGCQSYGIGRIGNKCYRNHTCDPGLKCFGTKGIPEVCADFGDGGVP